MFSIYNPFHIFLIEINIIFIQYFLEKTGHSGLNNIISAYEDKTAYAQCIFSYCGGRGQEVTTFVGRTEGIIYDKDLYKYPYVYIWYHMYMSINRSKKFYEVGQLFSSVLVMKKLLFLYQGFCHHLLVTRSCFFDPYYSYEEEFCIPYVVIYLSEHHNHQWSVMLSLSLFFSFQNLSPDIGYVLKVYRPLCYACN